MNKQKRDKLRELALAATPGERAVNGGDDLDMGDDRVYIGDVENAAYIAAANPATILALLDRIDELEGDAEPVAWFHENPLRADAISDYIKSLLVDGESSPGGIHRPMDEGDKYSIPLYLHPPTERAVPEGMMLFPKEAWKFLTGEGSLDGVFFGEEHSSHLPFWWRTYIRKMLAAAPGAGGES